MVFCSSLLLFLWHALNFSYFMSSHLLLLPLFPAVIFHYTSFSSFHPDFTCLSSHPPIPHHVPPYSLSSSISLTCHLVRPCTSMFVSMFMVGCCGVCSWVCSVSCYLSNDARVIAWQFGHHWRAPMHDKYSFVRR